MIKHPAKYNDKFIPIIARTCCGMNRILDPFAGTGKICAIKDFGYTGDIYCNELESEWIYNDTYHPDYITICDAEYLDYPNEYFDAIVTSPTYGNRMADHHKAKDGSKRLTYTHCLGHDLHDGNTGVMQWGVYKDKHKRIYENIVPMIKHNGLFVLNIKNHIRKGSIIDVVDWHINTLCNLGMIKLDDILVEVGSMKFGANYNARISDEHIVILKKSKTV